MNELGMQYTDSPVVYLDDKHALELHPLQGLSVSGSSYANISL